MFPKGHNNINTTISSTGNDVNVVCLSSLPYRPNYYYVADGQSIVIYKALCFDVAQGRMNGAPSETRTHSGRFASLAC